MILRIKSIVLRGTRQLNRPCDDERCAQTVFVRLELLGTPLLLPLCRCVVVVADGNKALDLRLTEEIVTVSKGD